MADIDRSTISLRIFGHDLDPDQITHRLGCPPTAAAKTGDTSTNQRGELRVVREGFWRLKSGESDATPLEAKLLDLLARLTDDERTWRDITQRYRTDLFCGLFLGVWNEGFTLTPTVMRLLAERQLPIGFAIYSPVDKDDDTP
jgi:hypothetical protein